MASTSTDINFMRSRFRVAELRKEITLTRNAIHGTTDYKLRAYYDWYIDLCQQAIAAQPKPVPSTNTKYESAESIKARIDIVDYIGQYVRLKKSGNKFQGLCPFHSDRKSPSFFVYPDQGTYHCYGCQSHGTVIDFVMKYENLDIKTALSKLSGV